MDKLLKPKDLDVLPTDSNAASVFKYWIATFESFLQAALEQAYSLERAQQQSSSYSINVASSNVVLHRQTSADSLAGADVGSAYDPVSDLYHGGGCI